MGVIAGVFKLIIESVLSELFIKMGEDHSLEDYINKGISLNHDAEDKSIGTSSNTGTYVLQPYKIT